MKPQGTIEVSDASEKGQGSLRFEVEGPAMTDTCHYRVKKIILAPGQNDNGKWVCELTIPEFKEPEIGKYQGHLPGEYETEREAKTAAFAYAKKILDPSNDER